MNKQILLILSIFTIINTACKKNESLVEVPANKIADTIRIVVLGASTAAGTGASTPDSAWTNRLQAKFTADHKKAKITNLAVGGYTTYQFLPANLVVPANRPATDTARNLTKALTYKPDLVLINLPSNDIAANYSDDEILSNFKSITTLLAIAHVPYILTGTQPRNFSSDQQRLRLKILNDKLKQVYNSSVDDYLDQLSTVTWKIIDKYSAGDGIHLNNKGHYLVFQSFINHPILKKLFQY